MESCHPSKFLVLDTDMIIYDVYLYVLTRGQNTSEYNGWIR